MKKVSISELKNSLSAILATLEQAGSILVTDRKIPVAIVYPAPKRGEGEQGRIARLVRSGVLAEKRTANKIDLLRRKGPALSKKLSAVDILVEERRSSR